MTILWAGFLLLVVLLLALDLGVINRKAHEIEFKEAALWSVFWIALGIGFTGVIYVIYDNHWFGVTSGPNAATSGSHAAVDYITGYLLEKSLSIDNIFVIALIFTRNKVEPKHRHRVLFWGILGAIVLRAIMITAGVWIIGMFDWVFYIFGAYLAYTGIKILFESDDDDADPDDNWFLRGVRRILPVTDADHEGHFTAKVAGKRVFTRLALVLLTIELMDVVFALDSVPAVLAITQDAFLVFTSNIFAILGLRALYFVLQNLIKRFVYLKHALSFILVFIGAKMIAHSWYKLPNLVSLAIIGVAVTLGVVVSLAKTRPDAEPTS